MDKLEFLNIFKECADKFDWKISKCGEILGFLKYADCDCCKIRFCPITAIARIKKSHAHAAFYVEAAARELNLQQEDFFEIVAAADNRKGALLRRELLAICNLSWKGEFRDKDFKCSFSNNFA